MIYYIVNMNNNTVYNNIVYMITGIIPYSGGERSVIAVYLDKDRAMARMNKERMDKYYIDISMDEYEVDD